MSLQVSLERFEGPLGLLLHLIREQEMNIFDIDISTITRQYLEYIKTMRSLDLELAGDFVAMAATLLQIKSRMLLPQYNEAGEEVESEDPRKELVNRLLEYQKYQDASKRLAERPWVGRDIWLRGERVNVLDGPNDEIELEENPLFSLISSYRHVIRSMKSGVHKVVGSLQSIAARILEMKDLLPVGKRVEFQELITVEGDKRHGQVLVTFLSLLELAKMGFVSLFQSETYGQIHVDAKRPIDGDVVSQVENYDNVHAERMAEQILAQSVEPEVAEEVLELIHEPELGGLEHAALEALHLNDGQVLNPASPPMALSQAELARREFDAPLSQEAASDDEIEAEERRLMAQESTGDAEL